MCDIYGVIEEYFYNDLSPEIEKGSLPDEYVSKFIRIWENNVQTIGVLEKIIASNDPGQILKFIQVHDNSLDPWDNENSNKAPLIDLGRAVIELTNLLRMIERSTLIAIIFSMDAIGIEGEKHIAFRTKLLKIWKKKKFKDNHYQMRVHSSHLGLTPSFAHGPLTGNSVLVGMYDLMERHRETWHYYTFNVCLIKVMDKAGDRTAGKGDFLLVTQNNRSCFTHSICQIPPLVFKLCEDDLTSNFRKFKFFKEKNLGTVVACPINIYSKVEDENEKNLDTAAKEGISPCVQLLRDAYKGHNEAEIVRHGEHAPYTDACLESTTVAIIKDSKKVTHKILVPSGLYYHKGILTIGSPAILRELWAPKQEPQLPPPVDMVDGMVVVPVKDDGHCLFGSIGPQVGMGVLALRTLASNHILLNPGLCEAEEDKVEAYCKDLLNMDGHILWGGDPELLALSHILGRRIIVHRRGKPFLTFDGDLIHDFVPKGPDIHILNCENDPGAGVNNHFDALRPPED